MDLAALRSDLQSLVGLRLTDAQANALLNEGNRELATRAEWTRARLNIGPTVAGTASYALPATVDRILDLSVDGAPFAASGETEVQQITTGPLRLATNGVWYPSFDEDGVEQITIYPTPGTSGLDIILAAVVTPALMVENDDEPNVPETYQPAIRDYAAALGYGFREDNPELRQFHMDSFERAVERLRRARTSRAGRGGARLRIEGWSA